MTGDKSETALKISLTLLGVCLLSLFLIIRSMGLLPVVFADEYTYSRLSRLLPLSEATIPSYLYLGLYRVTSFCGADFLGCARILNALLFSLSIPFIYSIARTVSSRRVAAFVTLLAVAGPVNSYTAYFMPESFYFLGIWVLIWSLIRLDSDSSALHWGLAGLIYGATALIKVHSLFFLPTMLMYLAFVHYRRQQLFRYRFISAVASFLIGAAAAKFMGGYMLAGNNGLALFGPFYESHAPTEYSYLNLLRLTIESGKGHLLALSLLYGLPIAAACSVLYGVSVRRDLPQTSTAGFEKATFLALVLILNLAAVAALFTASIANAGPYETPYRLHIRYYNFALPLFYVIAAGALSSVIAERSRHVCYVVGALLACCASWALYTQLSPYIPSFVDNPEIRGLQANTSAYALIGGLVLLSLIIWMFSQRKGAGLYLFLAAPLFIAVSSLEVTREQRNRTVPDAFDRAGFFARDQLSEEARAATMIIGSHPAGVFRTSYYLDDPAALAHIVAPGTEIDPGVIPHDRDWLLIIGDHRLLAEGYHQIHMDGFTLAKKNQHHLSFKDANWPHLINSVKGLSVAEHWGTWSASDEVTFVFTEPLPERFELQLTASAFGPNTGAEFQVTVGTRSYHFSLSESPQTRSLIVENPTGANTMKFIVPHPASPREWHGGDDDRLLGMAFHEMSIRPLSNTMVQTLRLK